MICQIHHLLSPNEPSLAAGRATIWSTILSDASIGVSMTFKFNRRWYRVTARPSGELTFVYRSNGLVVSPKVESNLIRFLAAEM